MSFIPVEPPYPYFTDDSGQSLKSGYIYVGESGLDPETNLIDVYFDSELTIPAAQPLRTLNGHISNAGAPARIYAGVSDCSITVRNKNLTLVYTELSASVLTSADNTVFVSDGVGAVQRTVHDKLMEGSVSVKDFGAVGDIYHSGFSTTGTSCNSDDIHN